MDAIVAENLHKHYKTVQALDGVSFAVREGEVFGLLGPNGAGKSTTVRVVRCPRQFPGTLVRSNSGYPDSVVVEASLVRDRCPDLDPSEWVEVDSWDMS